jgi:hypothetical protein
MTIADQASSTWSRDLEDDDDTDVELPPAAYTLDTVPTHVVIRPFTAEGRLLLRDELVDAATWRTTEALIDNRYLRRVDYSPATPTIPASGPLFCQCARLWAVNSEATCPGAQTCATFGTQP